MEFIEHTLTWIRGERIESIIIAVAGLLIIVSSILLWRFGNTPYAHALIVPLLVVGLIPLFMGVSGAIDNGNSIPFYEQAWQQGQENFILSEKARVESFDEIFKYTYPMAIILTIGGAILFFVLASPTWKAVSLAMMTLGLMTYFVDHFAAERAAIYLEHINTYIAQPRGLEHIKP